MRQKESTPLARGAFILFLFHLLSQGCDFGCQAQVFVLQSPDFVPVVLDERTALSDFFQVVGVTHRLHRPHRRTRLYPRCRRTIACFLGFPLPWH